MKRKILSITAAIGMFLTAGFLNSCTDYQDDYDSMNSRLTALEDLVNQANKDIQDVQTIVDAMEQGDYITSVTQVDNGYKITFKHYGEIVIKNGENGIDGTTPQLSIVKADPLGTGVESFYWSLNGVLIQVDGEYVKAVGEDGKDAPSPRLDIRDGKWYYTFDDESNPNPQWIEMGPAIGKDGADAQPLEMVFRSIEMKAFSVVFTLNQKDPQTNEYIKFEVPLYNEEFDRLFSYVENDTAAKYNNSAVMYVSQKVLVGASDFGFEPTDKVEIKVLKSTPDFVMKSTPENGNILELQKPAEVSYDGSIQLSATKTNSVTRAEDTRVITVFAGAPVLFVNQEFLLSRDSSYIPFFRGSLLSVRPQVCASLMPTYENSLDLPKDLVKMSFDVQVGDLGGEYYDTFIECVEDTKLVKENVKMEIKDGYLFIDTNKAGIIASERSYMMKVTVKYSYLTENDGEFVFYLDLNRPE